MERLRKEKEESEKFMSSVLGLDGAQREQLLRE